MKKNKKGATTKKVQTPTTDTVENKMIRAERKVANKEKRQANEKAKSEATIKAKTDKVHAKYEAKQAKKEAREKEYKDFRIKSLKRRCERQHLTEEATQKRVDELIAQMNEPTTYHITVSFNKDTANLDKEAIKNSNIQFKFLTLDAAYLDGDKAIVDKLREILDSKTRIYQYAVAKPKIDTSPKDESEVQPKPEPTPEQLAKKKKAFDKKLEKYDNNIGDRTRKSKKHIKPGHKFQKRTESLKHFRLSAKTKRTQKASKGVSSKDVSMHHKNPSNKLKTAKKAA